MNGFGEGSGRLQVRGKEFGLLVVVYTGLTLGCVQPENPEVLSPGSRYLRQWFHYFTSLQRETSFHFDRANLFFSEALHVGKYFYSIHTVNWIFGLRILD